MFFVLCGIEMLVCSKLKKEIKIWKKNKQMRNVEDQKDVKEEERR
jgi:hypothetical protein